MSKTLLIYIVIINVFTFFIYGIDKWKAKNHRWRIPEDTLLSLAGAGGSLGALLGIYAFHHKTKHKKFTLGVPLILIIQLILLEVYYGII